MFIKANLDVQVENSQFPLHDDPLIENPDLGPSDAGLQELQSTNPMPASSSTAARMGPQINNSNLVTGQFNFLSSEPYPHSAENPKTPQSPREGRILESARFG